MATAMGQWEYQVIRLNVEPPVASAPQQGQPQGQAPGAAAQPAAGSATAPDNAEAPKQVFSEAYLKEEFPRFYDDSSDAKKAAEQQAQQNDPAFQLKNFLNSQGQEGWELVGFQHAMPHVFIVFKRPKGADESVQAALAAQQEQLRLTLDLANRALAIIEKQSG
ncbi:MAG: hypothetical protein ACO24U_07700 [Prochlorococcaceae cyanobacterium]